MLLTLLKKNTPKNFEFQVKRVTYCDKDNIMSEKAILLIISVSRYNVAV